jgi:hypothetical protein
MRDLINLIETLDSRISYEWKDMSNDDVKLYIAEFMVDNAQFRVFFKKPYYNMTWEISFTRNGTYDLTGTGKAYLVMSGVVEIIGDFITRHDPWMFHFDAKKSEASRLKLYSRLVAVVGKKFPEYTVKKNSSSRRETHLMVRPKRELPTRIEVESRETDEQKQRSIDRFFAMIDSGELDVDDL